MKKARKTSDQMRQETIDALNLFIKNLKEYLRHGSYPIEYVDRDFSTKEVEGITMKLDEHKLFIRKDDAELHLQINAEIKDLLNQQLIDEYNRLTIDRDISYYEEKLKKLKAQKANLANAALQKIDEDEKGS